MQMRHEFLNWGEVDKLIDHLIPQFEMEFDGMVMITRGGIIPGGMLAEALGITHVLPAAVAFPSEMEQAQSKLYAWPEFIQFPSDEMLEARSILVVDDVWGSGRTITTVRNRVGAAGAAPYTCVLHFNPYRNLFGSARPDFFAATTDARIVYPWEIDRGTDGILRSPIGEG